MTVTGITQERVNIDSYRDQTREGEYHQFWAETLTVVGISQERLNILKTGQRLWQLQGSHKRG
jgi:hypothetical protein